MKSWKTTLTGILTILAAIIAPTLKYLHDGTMPDLVQTIALIAGGVGLINAKDNNVSNAMLPVGAKKVEEPQVRRATLPLIALLMIPVLMFSGCSTASTGNPLIDRRNRVANALLGVAAKTIGTFAVNTLKSVIQDEMSGSKIDFANSAADGLWATAQTAVNSSDIERVINAWGGDKLPLVAVAAKRQYDLAVSSGVAPEAAYNAIASVISGTAAAAK